ncbi:hypothetical protein BDV95DRAFT_141985 [Massariosphaeria phaeospora]|uniref:Uncharacterized protein n=1 Tax=Massariosphaeria phaeospora TaxID=100035 RepID=A0A7C8IPL6_9PLEO|nr:hypothetical protein BDV95DRAFT_141985 [Massariosphaeria phaeospora]
MVLLIMSVPSSTQDPLKEAVQNAKNAFSRLPNGDQTFQQCISSPVSIVDAIEKAQELQKEKKSTKILEGLQKHTAWLQNLSSVVDVVVQTEAGIGCPMWAPLKFLLQVVNQHSRAGEEIARLLHTVATCFRQVKLYQELGQDQTLHIPFLVLFTDIVDFSVQAIRYFGRSSVRRLAGLVFQPHKHEFAAMRERIREHGSDIRDAVFARELLHAKQARDFEASERQRRFRTRCEKWLRPCALNNVHHRQLQSRTKGTCQWIQQNPRFLEWRDRQGASTAERAFLISGTHGSGKSILASSIIEQFQKEGHRTLFFYFSSTDTHRQTVDSVARSFLARLLKQDPGDQVDRIIGALMDEGEQPLPVELWGALATVLKLQSLPTFCVIDGLDESTDQQEVCVRIAEILEGVKNVKCLLLARPQAFEALPTPMASKVYLLEIDVSLTQDDINTFLSEELDKIPLIETANLRDLAFDTLQEKSSNLFLWVRLMMSDLGKACTKHELKERLRNVPTGLEDAYRLVFLRIMQRLDDWEIQRTRTILALIITARRPLRVEEMSYALGLWMRSRSKSITISLEEFMPFDAEKTILSGCGDLAVVANGTVVLNHSSAKDFLCRDEMQWTRPNDKQLLGFRIDPTETHGVLASLCLDYMDLQDLGYPMKEPDTLIELRRQHPFVEYASYNFFFHLRNSPVGFAGVIDRLKSIASTSRLISWIEHGAVSWTEEAFDSSLMAMDDYSEEYVQQWQSMIGYDDEVRVSATTQLNQELALRTSEFGPGDYRTVIFSGIISFTSLGETHTSSSGGLLQFDIEMPDMDCSRDAAPQGQPGSPRNAQVSQIPPHQDAVSVLNDAARYLTHSQIVPSHSIAMFLRIMRHCSQLQNARQLVDPLLLLFQLILQKAKTLPVYVVLGICEFFENVGKAEQGLQLCLEILPRVDGRGSRAESLTYRYLARQYKTMEGKQADAIMCVQRVVSVKEHFWLMEDNRRNVVNSMVDPDERIKFLKNLLELDTKRYGKQATATLETQFQLARTFSQVGATDEAMEMMRATWIAGKKRQRHDSNATFEACKQMGIWLQNDRRFHEAQAHYIDLCTWIGSATRANHDWYRDTHDRLAQTLDSLGRPEDSLRHSLKAYSVAKKFALAEARYSLGSMVYSLIGTSRYKHSTQREKLLLTYANPYGKAGKPDLDIMKALASALEIYHQYEEAAMIWQRVLVAETAQFPDDPKRLLATRRSLNDALERLDRHEESILSRRSIAESLKKRYGEDDDDYTAEQESLALTLYNLNRWDEALQCWHALGINTTGLPPAWRTTIDQICTDRMLSRYDNARDFWADVRKDPRVFESCLTKETAVALWQIASALMEGWEVGSKLTAMEGRGSVAVWDDLSVD